MLAIFSVAQSAPGQFLAVFRGFSGVRLHVGSFGSRLLNPFCFRCKHLVSHERVGMGSSHSLPICPLSPQNLVPQSAPEKRPKKGPWTVVWDGQIDTRLYRLVRFLTSVPNAVYKEQIVRTACFHFFLAHPNSCKSLRKSSDYINVSNTCFWPRRIKYFR